MEKIICPKCKKEMTLFTSDFGYEKYYCLACKNFMTKTRRV